MITRKVRNNILVFFLVFALISTSVATTYQVSANAGVTGIVSTVGSVLSSGWAVYSAAPIIVQVLIALGLGTAAFFIANSDKLETVVDAVMEGISGYLIGDSDNPGIILSIKDGITGIQKDLLEAIASSALGTGLFDATIDMQFPSPVNGTYKIESYPSVSDSLDYIASLYGRIEFPRGALRDKILSAFGSYAVYYFYRNDHVNNVMFSLYPVSYAIGGTYTFPVATLTPRLDVGFEFNDSGGDSRNNGYASYGSTGKTGYINFTNAVTIGMDSVPVTGNDASIDANGDVVLPSWAGEIFNSLDRIGDLIETFPLSIPDGLSVPYTFPADLTIPQVGDLIGDLPIPYEGDITDVIDPALDQTDVQDPNGDDEDDDKIYQLPETTPFSFTFPMVNASNFKNKWPFTIPSDLMAAVSSLSAVPSHPSVDVDVSGDSDVFSLSGRLSFDLSFLDDYIVYERKFVLLSFCVALLVFSYKMWRW